MLPIITFAILIPIALFLIEWSVHISQAKDVVKAKTRIKTKWSSFHAFKEEVMQYEWFASDTWKNSLFMENIYLHEKFYIHAEILLVNGISYMLYPWSYAVFKVWNRSYSKKLREAGKIHKNF